MNHCENDDFEGKYSGSAADTFTAKVNGKTVDCDATVIGANRMRVTVSQAFYSAGDTLVIYKNGDVVGTINIIDCP